MDTDHCPWSPSRIRQSAENPVDTDIFSKHAGNSPPDLQVLLQSRSEA